LTITISTSISGTALLNGSYAFEFSGFDSNGNFTVTTGSFAADGNGNITSGVEDFNAINGSPKNQTFNGTYALGSDNRGQLVLSSLTGSPTFAFAIDSQGAHGRLIEIDASGIHGSGELIKQTVSTCSSNTISGQYVIGTSGYAAGVTGVTQAGAVVFAGSFTATPTLTSGGQGALGPGEVDANTPGFATTAGAESVSGTYQPTLQSARCTMAFSPASLASLTFSVYPVSATEAFLVETDNTGNSATPYLTSGHLIQQVGPFYSSSSFNGTSVAGLTAEFLPAGGTSYLPDVSIVSMTSTGANTFELFAIENQAGVITNNISQPISGTYTIDTFGRVQTSIPGTQYPPVFYLINQGQLQAVMISLMADDPTFGYFETQAGGPPFSASTVTGKFVEGTSEPTGSAVEDLSGVISIDGVSAVTGTQDQSTTLDQTVTGTYALTSTGSTDGSGTFTLTSPTAFDGEFFIVSSTKMVMITTTAGDKNPALIILGN
jgi:hypothetical protein